jgi:hypothetical protein
MLLVLNGTLGGFAGLRWDPDLAWDVVLVGDARMVRLVVLLHVDKELRMASSSMNCRLPVVS